LVPPLPAVGTARTRLLAWTHALQHTLPNGGRHDLPNCFARLNGAVEEDTTWYHETLWLDYVSQVRDEARDHGYLTELFVVEHEHAPVAECECVQYLTDHMPVYVWNDAHVNPPML
jgi:hypothetical protein